MKCKQTTDDNYSRVLTLALPQDKLKGKRTERKS